MQLTIHSANVVVRDTKFTDLHSNRLVRLTHFYTDGSPVHYELEQCATLLDEFNANDYLGLTFEQASAIIDITNEELRSNCFSCKGCIQSTKLHNNPVLRKHAGVNYKITSL